jgi:hypothetical protein
MQAPSPRQILTRALLLLAALVVALYAISFVKKKQRESAILADLKVITGDGSFFQQFYAEQAERTLVRAVALIAEAKSLGLDPDQFIDRSLGLEAKFFASDGDKDEPPLRTKIIRACLRTNYQNFLKLGYTGDYHTLVAMKKGELPAIPEGPDQGQKPVVVTLIDGSISPGIEKVLANLQIRPPAATGRPLTDIEVALAKQLARDLTDAQIIEEPVRDKILQTLTPAPM